MNNKSDKEDVMQVYRFLMSSCMPGFTGLAHFLADKYSIDLIDVISELFTCSEELWRLFEFGDFSEKLDVSIEILNRFENFKQNNSTSDSEMVSF